MTPYLVLVAFAMAAVTYPSRALPLIAPGVERLPRRALQYLRLVGPSVLAALAAVNAVVVTESGTTRIAIGIVTAGTLLGLVIVVWRRNLLLGLVAAVALVAVSRATGIAPLP
ncbi:MAG: AzlD domain-containing protein [Chloroflexota bacterium]|jgi:branched-subunit amino acid transport protein